MTNPTSPKAAQAQAFVDFLQSDAGKTALRQHGTLPYHDGASWWRGCRRRSRILAEVGARVPHPTPLAAPGATYSSRVALAPTSQRTMDAKDALLKRRLADAQASATAAATPPQPAGASVADEAGTAPGHRPQDNPTTGAKAIYTVVKGDTLSSIAEKHSVQVSQLRKWNHLKSNQIQLGQTLRVSNN